MCFNLGFSDTELLSLHWSSSHTWHFWGCRWRLSTSISLYLTHPLCLNFFVRSVFSFCFVLRATTHLLLYYLFLSCPSASLFFFCVCFFFLFHYAPGCRTFQWNRMFPPVQLPADNYFASVTSAHLFTFTSSAPSLQGHQHLLLCFLLIILSPPVAPAMSFNESSHQLMPWSYITTFSVSRYLYGSHCITLCPVIVL